MALSPSDISSDRQAYVEFVRAGQDRTAQIILASIQYLQKFDVDKPTRTEMVALANTSDIYREKSEPSPARSQHEMSQQARFKHLPPDAVNRITHKYITNRRRPKHIFGCFFRPEEAPRHIQTERQHFFNQKEAITSSL